MLGFTGFRILLHFLHPMPGPLMHPEIDSLLGYVRT